MSSILTAGQRRLHRVLLASAAVLLATSLYLYVRAPASGTFPRPYQAILLVHLALGLVVLIPATTFVLWHLPRALARKNNVAVVSGTLLALLALALAATGVALAVGVAADRAFWSLVAHRAGAAVLPLLYLLHRREGQDRPGFRQVARAALVLVLGTGALVGLDLATVPARKPEAHSSDQNVSLAGKLDAHSSDQNASHAGKPDASTANAAAAGDAAALDPFVPWGRSPGAPLPSDPFFPSSVLTRSGQLAPMTAILGREVTPAPLLDGKPVSPGAQACVRCHPDVVAQWESSAHRQSSFANPFYARAVEALRADPDDGIARARWCAGCHDPAVLLTGKWGQPIERTDVHARAGLTCLSCHAIEHVRDKGGNGGYVLRDDPTDPYLGGDAAAGSLAEVVHDRLVKSHPSVHKQQMLEPGLFRSGEFCASCHKVSLEAPVNHYRWLRGQDDYDSWHASGANHAAAGTFYLPPSKKSCNDCHMPPEAATRGDVSAKGGMVRSHRFPGANTALPQLTHDQAQLDATIKLLKSSCRVDVFALAVPGDAAPGQGLVAPLGSVAVAALPAGRYELDVVVRNTGVGHAFPGGTLDSNEVWLEVTAGRLLSSGGLDATGERDPNAHVYRALFLDRQGEPIAKRNPQDIRANVYARAIGPSRSDVVRYHFDLPEGGIPPEGLKVTARLRYRKFTPAYTRYALGREPETAPLVVDCATDSVVLKPGVAPEPAPNKPPVWERWNDFGVGLLDQGDTRAAVAAFAAVATLAPTKADGPRNEARCALREGRIEAALAYLDEAERRAPNDPQNAFFWGEALQRQGRLVDAAKAYARVLERFPQDREARRGLAEAHLKVAATPDDYRRALADFLALLELDPEDRGAHYRRIAIYRALGDEASARAAEQAYERFRLDEDSKVTAPVEAFERAHPEANLESQAVHVH